jgi:hypothetical protein
VVSVGVSGSIASSGSLRFTVIVPEGALSPPTNRCRLRPRSSWAGCRPPPRAALAGSMLSPRRKTLRRTSPSTKGPTTRPAGIAARIAIHAVDS